MVGATTALCALGAAALAPAGALAQSPARATGGSAAGTTGQQGTAQPPSNGVPVPAFGATGPTGPLGTTGTTGTTGATGLGGALVGAATMPTAPLAPSVIVLTGAVGLRVRPAVWLGSALNFHGTVAAAYAGVAVQIQRYQKSAQKWATIAHSTVAGGGQFMATWRSAGPGQYSFRAVVGAPASAARAGQGNALPQQLSGTAEITVYTPAIATYFGPGFYTNQTACGQKMTASLLGVANRTLPCGTMVQIEYAGRVLSVPVVDRGPYANGADWDLTIATAQALGMTETETIGTIVTYEPPTQSSGASSPSSSSAATPSKGSGSGSASTGATGGTNG